MKSASAVTNKKSLSSSELVQHLANIANKEGISFAETVRRTMESNKDKDLRELLEAFNTQSQ